MVQLGSSRDFCITALAAHFNAENRYSKRLTYTTQTHSSLDVSTHKSTIIFDCSVMA